MSTYYPQMGQELWPTTSEYPNEFKTWCKYECPNIQTCEEYGKLGVLRRMRPECYASWQANQKTDPTQSTVKNYRVRSSSNGQQVSAMSDSPQVVEVVHLARNATKEVPVEVVKQISVEVPVEVPVEVVKQISVEVPKEISVEIPVDVVRYVSVDVPIEVIKEVSVEIPVGQSDEIEQLKLQMLSAISMKMDQLSSMNVGINEMNVKLSGIIYQNDNPKPIPIYYA